MCVDALLHQAEAGSLNGSDEGCAGVGIAALHFGHLSG